MRKKMMMMKNILISLRYFSWARRKIEKLILSDIYIVNRGELSSAYDSSLLRINTVQFAHHQW